MQLSILIIILRLVNIVSLNHIVRIDYYDKPNVILKNLEKNCGKLIPSYQRGFEFDVDFISIRTANISCILLLSFVISVTPDNVVCTNDDCFSSVESIVNNYSMGRRLLSFGNEVGYKASNININPFLTTGRRSYSDSRKFSGKKVKVAIFDSGLNKDHPDFKNVVEIINWSTDETDTDEVGHGTFVAGVISSTNVGCEGIASDTELYVFKLFTSSQMSYTSWFLDAFNYALYLNIDVINFSVGGPDRGDKPFTDKIHEVAAAGVIIVSAVGNDGKYWGSHLSPADMMDVIGVGGYNNSKDLQYLNTHGDQPISQGVLQPFSENSVHQSWGSVSTFSSKGMTSWELPLGVGQVKPDLLAPSFRLTSSSARTPGKCTILSGTSVASPIVAAAAAVLLSSSDGEYSDIKPSLKRKYLRNVAAIKQILFSACIALPNYSMYEQGCGLLDMQGAVSMASNFSPHVSVFPKSFSNKDNARLFYPVSRAKLFYSSIPVLFNATILNSVCVRSRVSKIRLVEKAYGEDNTLEYQFESDWASPSNGLFSLNGMVLKSVVIPSVNIVPWAGYISMSFEVLESKKDFIGIVVVSIEIQVQCGDPLPEVLSAEMIAAFTATLQVIKRPERSRRILWDVYHNLLYPSGFIPRDNLQDKKYLFDWLGDHPNSNYIATVGNLEEKGYIIETLRNPMYCLNISQYSMLMIIDPEDIISSEELLFLELSIRFSGLSLLVIGDWYDNNVMQNIEHFDENTKSKWYPTVGGSNIHLLNLLLQKFNGGFGFKTFQGNFEIKNGAKIPYLSGNSIGRWPKSGSVLLVHPGELVAVSPGNLRSDIDAQPHAVGATLSLNSERAGRVAVYGDSSCFDGVSVNRNCMDLLFDIIDYLINNTTIPYFTRLIEDYVDMTVLRDSASLAERNSRQDDLLRLSKFSNIAECNNNL